MTAGYYSGGIVAEDVDPSGSPKSKSHVDFILDLQPKSAVAFTAGSIPETRNVRVEKNTTFAFSITGTAIETQSLGDDIFYEGSLIGTIDPALDGVGKALGINFTTTARAG